MPLGVGTLHSSAFYNGRMRLCLMHVRKRQADLLTPDKRDALGLANPMCGFF